MIVMNKLHIVLSVLLVTGDGSVSHNKEYNIFTSNCAHTVQNALMTAGLNPGWGMLPRLQVFPSITGSNRGVYYQYYNTKTRKNSK